MTIILPNIRKLFIPDQGHFIASVDLAGADAQVVAWEAEDDDLKSAFRAGIPIHQKNAEDLFGLEEESRGNACGARGGDGMGGHTGPPPNGTPRPSPSPAIGQSVTVHWPNRGRIPKHKEYQNCKQGVHAVDYGAAAKTVAATLGWKISEAASFKGKWFALHPNIPNVWHVKVQDELNATRTASNRFGYRIKYFDRVEKLLPEALAWGPQSTVAITCNRGGAQLRRNIPWIDLLMQVHDELVFQFPWKYEDRLKEIRDTLRVEIPYDDPLVIPWKLSMSRKSWGDCADNPRDWE